MEIDRESNTFFHAIVTMHDEVYGLESQRQA